MHDRPLGTVIVTDNQKPMRRSTRARQGRIGYQRAGTELRGLAARRQQF